MSGIKDEKKRAEEMAKLIRKLGGEKKTIMDGEGFNFPLMRTIHANGGIDGTEALMERDKELRRKIRRQKRRR